MKPAIQSAWWVLRLAFGLGPLLAGGDKFFNLEIAAARIVLLGMLRTDHH